MFETLVAIGIVILMGFGGIFIIALIFQVIEDGKKAFKKQYYEIYGDNRVPFEKDEEDDKTIL